MCERERERGRERMDGVRERERGREREGEIRNIVEANIQSQQPCQHPTHPHTHTLYTQCNYCHMCPC